MIKVFIAEDHFSVREGLKQIISDERDMLVIGEAVDAEAILDNTERMNWDVLVLDLAMPASDALGKLSKLKNKYPESRILVLSMDDHPEVASRALDSGADGYLNKDSVSDELPKAVRILHEGKKFIGKEIIH